jgi:hypothetical protein
MPEGGASDYRFTVIATDATRTQISQEVRLVVRPPAEPLWRKVLGWVRWAVSWAIWLLGLFLVGVLTYFALFGQPPTTSEGFDGLLSEWVRRMREPKSSAHQGGEDG